MPVTELTPTQAELLEQIQAWWKKHAPSSKVPEGTRSWDKLAELIFYFARKATGEQI